MWTQILQKRKLSLAIGALTGAVLGLALLYLQNDLHRNHLDPKIPFQIYRLPAAPDYSQASGWFLNPAIAKYYADPRKVDVFFVHGTSFDGGRNWLDPLDSRAATEHVERVQLPNYAGPFTIMGNIYAPKYREASLFTQMTLREDARDARQFAYRDVAAAFAQFLKTRKGGRGFMIVGLEQGGLLSERLLRDFVAPDPKLKSQLVAAYLLETLVPQSQFNSDPATFPPCTSRTQTGCIFSYMSVDSGRPDKALQNLQKAVYWHGPDTLATLGSQKAICVNPLTGNTGEEEADSHHALGATNATGLEWGTEPALITRKVSAHCLSGLLFVEKPKSPYFKLTGTWEDKRKVNPYNLFYGDIEADMQARWQTFQAEPQS